MNCPACGNAYMEGSAFCQQCGATLGAQAAPPPGMAMPGPVPVMPQAAPPVAPNAQMAQMNALIASMSMGEKVSAVGAIAALVGFFLPMASMLGQSASGFQVAKEAGAVYFLPLLALVAGGLCYLSSKATPGKKLMFAGYLVLLGALCGPGWLVALLFVSQLQSVAGIGLWLLALGYTAIAAGGLMTIRSFSSRVY